MFLFTRVTSIVHGYPLWVGVAFVGKELQYVLYSLFFAVFAARNARFAVVSFVVVALLIFIFPLWQVYHGQYLGYYGIRFPFEVGILASSEIGAISAILFVCSFCIMLNKKKLMAHMGKWGNIGVYPLVVISFLVLLLTISRSNIIGALTAIIILTLMKTLRKRLTLNYLAGFILTVVISALILKQLPVYTSIVNRFMFIKDYALPDRVESWTTLLSYQFGDLAYEPFAGLVGFGLGSPGFLLEGQYHGFTLGVDSQYVRRLFEVGIIGSILWLSVLASIGTQILKNARGTVYYIVFRDIVLVIFITMLISSLGLEVFQVIRTASTFYALMGILLGLSFKERQFVNLRTL